MFETPTYKTARKLAFLQMEEAKDKEFLQEAYFEDDIVSTPQGRIGTVERVKGDQDLVWDGFSSSDDGENVPDGSIGVRWFDGLDMELDEEDCEIVPTSNVKLLDRSLQPGDIVRQKDRVGMVLDVHCQCDVKYLHEKREKVAKVPHEMLIPLTLFHNSTVVAHPSMWWAGRVSDHTSRVRCTGKNGVCELGKCEDELNSERIYPCLPLDSSSKVWTKATWILGEHTLHGEMHVNRKYTEEVEVQWVLGSATFHSEMEEPSPIPPRKCSPQDLVPLLRFVHANWNVGDIVLYDKAPFDWKAAIERHSVHLSDPPRAPSHAKGRRKRQNQQLRKGDCSRVCVIQSMQCTVQVLWQDGTEEDVTSIELLPKELEMDAHDFFPYAVVKRKGQQHPGVIQRVDAKERMCDVRWLRDPLPSTNDDIEERYNGPIEKVAVYELEHWENSNAHSIGDIVIRGFQVEGEEKKPWIGELVRMFHGAYLVCWLTHESSWEWFSDVMVVEENALWADSSDEEEDFSEDPSEEEKDLEVEQEEESSEDEEAIDIPSNLCVVESSVPEDFGVEKVNKITRAQQMGSINEWKVLAKGELPETITVVAFSNTAAHWRACIVGTKGTPYVGIPLVFDIQLSEQHPHEPPVVRFHTCGLHNKINPNLYVDGTICFSLLNTWKGPGWKSHFTLMQVLVSIQALILNTFPYFNESGFEKRVDDPAAREEAKFYNESAHLDGLRYRQRLLAHPPLGMEDILHDIAQCFRLQVKEMAEAAASGDPLEMFYGQAGSDGYRKALEALLETI